MANPNPFSSGTEVAPRASDAFERALLDSARNDEVPDGARGRVALALGIGVPVAGLDSANPGAATHDTARSTSAGHARRGDAVAAGGGPLALAGKVALVSLAGGLAALLLLARSNDPGAAAAAMAPAARAPAALSLPASSSGHERSNESLVPSAAAPPPVAIATDAVALGATATPATPFDVPKVSTPRAASRSASRTARPAASHATHPPAADGASRLLAEVARLDQARAALAAADPARALQHVERYRAEFPNGALAREAARIEARARAQTSGSIGQARDIGGSR